MLCGRNGALLLALISVVQVSCVSSSTEAVGIEEVFSQEARQEPSGIFDLIGGHSRKLLNAHGRKHKHGKLHRKLVRFARKTANHRKKSQKQAGRQYLRGAKKLRCANPGSPTFGRAQRTNGGGVSYSCNQGYKLVGSSHRSCTDQGVWSGGTPSCRLHIKRENDGQFHDTPGGRDFVIGVSNAN